MKQLKQKAKELSARISEINVELDIIKKEHDVIVEAMRILDGGPVPGLLHEVPEFTSANPAPDIPPPTKLKPQKKTRKPRKSPKPRRAKKPRNISKKKLVKGGTSIGCGNGTRTVKPGTNIELSIKALRSRAPHWMRPAGIAEAIFALRLKKEGEVSRNYAAILSGDLKKLREGKHNVPGFEYQMIGKLAEYRINVVEEKEGSHSA